MAFEQFYVVTHAHTAQLCISLLCVDSIHAYDYSHDATER
jgi:hypothetical protein